VEVSAMALGDWVPAMAVVLGESVLVLVHHRCTMEQGHWHRRFRCKFRNLQQTGGTNRCCRRRSQRNLPQTCSNLQSQVVTAQVVLVPEELALVLAHHHYTTAPGRWYQRFRCRSHNLQQTGGTNQCCRRHSQRNLPRTCSNPQR